MINSSLQIRLGVIISYLTTFFYILVGIFYTPYLIKGLGYSDYGLYTIVTTLITTISLDFGITKAQTRFISRYLAEKKEFMVSRLLGVTFRLFILMDILLLVICLVIYGYAEYIFVKLTPVELIRFKNVLLISSFFLIFTFPLLSIGGLFIAYERIIQLKLFDLAYKIISVSALVLVLYFQLGLYVLVFVSLLLNLLFQLLKLCYVKKELKIGIDIGCCDKKILKDLWNFSSWETLRMLSSQFMLPFIPTILAVVSNTYEIALFAIVITLLSSIQMIATATNGVFLPKVMNLVVKKSDGETYTQLMIKVGRLTLCVIGCIVVALFCFGYEFFSYWLGPNYERACTALLLVLIPLLFHPTQIVANELFYAHNKVKNWALINLLASILCIVGVLFLAYIYGAIGASIALTFSYIIAFNICFDIQQKKLFNIKIWTFFYECHIKIFPSLFLSFIFGLFLQLLWKTDNLFYFLCKLVVWGFFYIMSIYFIALNYDEKKMLNSIFCKNEGRNC